MGKIITQNTQGHLKVVDEQFPLPVTVKDSVPFYFSSDIESFTIEMDPCLWRRAIQEILLDENETPSSIDTLIGWNYSQVDPNATTPLYQMPAQRAVVIKPSSDGFRVDYVNTSNGSSVNSARLDRPLSAFDRPSGAAREFYLRSRPIQISTKTHIPSILHIFAQSSEGAQNNANAQSQVFAVFIGAAYPVSSNNHAIDYNTLRWIAIPICQGNNVMFGRFTLPSTPVMGGLSPGSTVGAVTYTFPFPNISPFSTNASPPTNWFWYLVTVGYFNTHSTIAVRQPYGVVTVEAEVIPGVNP